MLRYVNGDSSPLDPSLFPPAYGPTVLEAFDGTNTLLENFGLISELLSMNAPALLAVLVYTVLSRRKAASLPSQKVRK